MSDVSTTLQFHNYFQRVQPVQRSHSQVHQQPHPDFNHFTVDSSLTLNQQVQQHSPRAYIEPLVLLTSLIILYSKVQRFDVSWLLSSIVVCISFYFCRFITHHFIVFETTFGRALKASLRPHQNDTAPVSVHSVIIFDT